MHLNINDSNPTSRNTSQSDSRNPSKLFLRTSGTGNSLDQITEQEDSEDLEGGEPDDRLDFNLKKNSVSDISSLSKGSYFTLNISNWLKGDKNKKKKNRNKRRLVS